MVEEVCEEGRVEELPRDMRHAHNLLQPHQTYFRALLANHRTMDHSAMSAAIAIASAIAP